MSSRPYVAHDHAVSVVRMYIQMIFIGLFLSGLLYASLMGTFLSRFIGGPIPEAQHDRCGSVCERCEQPPT